VEAKESVTPVARPLLGRDALTQKTNERLAANTPGNPSFEPSEMEQMHHGMSGMERHETRQNWHGENGFGRETEERKSVLHVQNASADSSGQAGEMFDLRPHPDQEKEEERK